MDKKNIIIGVLILLLGISTFYIGYDKFLSKDSNQTNDSEKVESNNQDNDNQLDNNVDDSDSEEEFVEIKLDKDGNLYYLIDNKKETISTNVLNFDYLYKGNGGERILYFLKEDGTVSSANGISIETPESSKITINKNNLDIKNNIGGYKNIIGFIEGVTVGAASPMFIDINGNMYNESISERYVEIEETNNNYETFKNNFIKNREAYYDDTKDRIYFEVNPKR